METTNKCANCLHELDVGIDMIQVSEGVMGTKGFVPLEKVLNFCCDDCISAYYDVSGLPSIPPRIP